VGAPAAALRVGQKGVAEVIEAAQTTKARAARATVTIGR
jgi:hypothetical protein